MMTDPIADMLTRMRNALSIRRKKVQIPRSRMKVGIAEVLKREGYIGDFRLIEAKPDDMVSKQGYIEIDLKYGAEGEEVMTFVQRSSKPGRRVYSKVDDLPLVLNGLGISILSTSQGIISDREARQKHVGGEVLCTVY
jgi:small subunit ribosomal protein S8